MDGQGAVIALPPPSRDGVRATSGVGEVEIRGPTVFAGYLHQSEQQRKESFSADGFFRTGDVGFFDSCGYLTVCDRAKVCLMHVHLLSCARPDVCRRFPSGHGARGRRERLLRRSGVGLGGAPVRRSGCCFWDAQQDHGRDCHR